MATRINRTTINIGNPVLRQMRIVKHITGMTYDEIISAAIIEFVRRHDLHENMTETEAMFTRFDELRKRH